MNDLEFAVALVRKAGKYIKNALGGAVETHWKLDNTPVTDIDIAVNSMAIERIKERYPADRVYGEEASSEDESNSEFTWILDPIDGTQALGKLDTFTVCLARLDGDGQPLFSVVYNPLRDELFTARKGEQSMLNDQPLRVSSKDTIKSSYIHFGSRLAFDDLVSNGILYDRLESQGAKIFNTRSLAHGCVEVASGEFEGAFIGVTKPFEAASVKLIVEGAGGTVTDLYGNPSARLDGEIKGMVVSNGHIHETLTSALKR
jgi:myo-inositol-1(or 4)-monophosphatase